MKPTQEQVIAWAREAGSIDCEEVIETVWAAFSSAERERICEAIKSEDDYCVNNGDYMLDSDDCIAVARGTWVRPEFDLDDAAICVRGQK